MRISARDLRAINAEVSALFSKPKRAKYGNRRTTVDGVKFDSAKEAKRWGELKLLERAGEITGLVRQYPLELHAALTSEKIGAYIADFAYLERGERVYEDCKGGEATKTDLYKWKKRHVKAQYGISIREV